VKSGDRELGMNRPISRRDFLNGVQAVAAGMLVPGCAGPVEPAGIGNADYPPLRSGLRGSHAGSFEVAHELAFRGREDWGPVDEPDSGIYDLVVVGGGISGLSAAYFQLRQKPSARILILDNHDDFGGHAKRNEFRIGERTLIGYGGSQTLEAPEEYSDVSKELLRELGVELERFESAYDADFYRRHGLGGGVFFDRAHYGADRVVRCEILDFSGYLPLSPSTLTAADAVAQMPLSDRARVEMLRLLEARDNRLTEIPADRQEAYLQSISYRDFLERHLDIHEPDVFALLEGVSTDIGVTIDTAPALVLLAYVGMPGIGATSLPRYGFADDPYIAHFPDGNASIARLLVRAMIPRVAAGSGMDDIVGARFDYTRLDEPGSSTRLRLNSTVVRVEHEGSAESADRVAVTYIHAGRAHRIWARSCVLAGYNAMAPHLCPELPANQREAMTLAVRVPILYSTVLLRNWQAWNQLGIAAVAAPGSYHANAMLDFPVSLGGYEFSSGPDEPITVHMERFGTFPGIHRTPRDQYRAERHRLLVTPFADIEREIRIQLAGTLAEGGFDPVRDIEAITVNRWAHGYANYYNPLFDAPAAPDELPHVVARTRFGRVAIASSDSGARATIDSAIDQAYRAIEELAGGSSAST
jgi:spermidine dehydrogenase